MAMFFIDDVGDEYGVFQTTFFKGFRAQKDADADGYKHDRRHVQMHLRAQQVQITADGIGRLKNGERSKQHQQAKLSVLRSSQISQAQNSSSTSQ